jgi:rhodanese-related sulfurtransferase
MARLLRLLAGFLVIAYLLVQPLSAPAEAAAIAEQADVGMPPIDAAVGQYLSSMPADYHAVRSVSALKRLLASSDSMLVDVRSSSEYKAGHIPGAVNIPLQVLGLHAGEIPVEKTVVLYCSTGYRSAMGVMALQLEGRDRAMGFPPSFKGWSAAGEPVVRSSGSGEQVS